MNTHTIEIDGQPLVYSTAGSPEKPALLLVHGWGSHRGVWRTTMEALQDRWFCVALDLLGLGDSPAPPAADYSIGAQAARIVALADALRLERFALMGHSMGGQIALHVAARTAPARVAALVDVDGVVTGRLCPGVEYLTAPMALLAYYLPGIVPLLEAAKGVPWLMKYVVFRTWFYDMDNPRYEDWALDREKALNPRLRETLWHTLRALRRANLAPHLYDVRAPALVVFGKHDDVVPVAQGALAAQRIPGARLALLDACGHFPMYERPRRFFELVSAFLDNALHPDRPTALMVKPRAELLRADVPAAPQTRTPQTPAAPEDAAPQNVKKTRSRKTVSSEEQKPTQPATTPKAPPTQPKQNPAPSGPAAPPAQPPRGRKKK